MKRYLMLLCAVTLISAGAVSAQVGQGRVSLDVLLGYTTVNAEAGGGDLTAYIAMGAFEYFVTPEVSAGATALYAKFDAGDAGDIDVWAIGGIAKYHFMVKNTWVPYVGAQLLWGSADAGDGSTDALIYGPVAGIRYALNANNDLLIQYMYLLFDGDAGDAIKDAHGIFAAIAHWFK